jgi:outer membrane protein
MIGVQLTIPLYTGGYRSARQDEALRLADKAETDASRSRQQTALQIRSLWLGLTVGAARVAALAESSRSSQARLDATRLGNEVGDRTTLDLLNAENDAANAELMLLQARIGLLLDRLRLAALAAELDEAQLQMVNAALQAGEGG